MKEHAETAMPALSRRAFVGTAAVTAGAVAATSLVGCGSTGGKKADKQEEAATDPYEGAQIFYSTCPPECQHHNLKAYVIDGKIAKVESSELNDCAACARGIARGFMTKDPDRLTKPLLRTGDKGSGEFKEIEWSEAFDLIQ